MYGETYGSVVYGDFSTTAEIPEPELVGINDQLVIVVEIHVIQPVA